MNISVWKKQVLDVFKFNFEKIDFVLNFGPDLVRSGVRMSLDVGRDPQNGLRPRGLDLVLLRQMLEQWVANLKSRKIQYYNWLNTKHTPKNTPLNNVRGLWNNMWHILFFKYIDAF